MQFPFYANATRGFWCFFRKLSSFQGVLDFPPIFYAITLWRYAVQQQAFGVNNGLMMRVIFFSHAAPLDYLGGYPHF